MGYFLGLDVSDATTNLCFIDEKGNIVHEAIVSTTPQDIESQILLSCLSIEKIGLETGAKSNFLVRALSSKYAIECYDACKMAKFISMKVNKTDKNDARIIAEVTRLHSQSNIMSLDVHVKEQYCSEVISMIRCREALVQQNIDTYNRVRAVLRTHGFPTEKWSSQEFIKAITQMIPTLPFYIAESIKALFVSYESILHEIERLDKIIATTAEQNPNAKLLMTIPEIGPLTGLYLAVLIDDPKRFADARDMGSYLGLTPSQYSSGERTLLSDISKKGDAFGRKLLVGAARRILQKNRKKSALKKWGKRIEKRRGKNRAAVALARHLAVIALALLLQQTVYDEPLLKKEHHPATLTVEEVAILQKLAHEKGNIEFRSFQQLKNIITAAKA